jgi:hypothetical protein
MLVSLPIFYPIRTAETSPSELKPTPLNRPHLLLEILAELI